jgi:hypothetical protein
VVRKKLGTMLIEAGLLTEQALRVALNEQTRWGGSLGHTIVELKLVSEAELVRVLAQQLKVDVVDLDAIEIPQAVLAHVNADFADLHAVVPYAQPLRFLDVAMADPTNSSVLDELRIRTKLNIRPALVGPKVLARAIAKYYGRGFSRFYGDIPLALDSVGPDLTIEKSAHEPPLDDLLVEERAPAVRPKRAAPPLTKPPPVPHVATTGASAELAVLERRVAQLEAIVAKQDATIGKLVASLVGHGLGSRDDFR